MGIKPVKILKQASPMLTNTSHRPPHAWLTPADMVLALPPPQLRTSASANQDFQARGKITLALHLLSLPTSLSLLQISHSTLSKQHIKLSPILTFF